MAYTTINKSTEHFNTTLHTGNGSTQSITGVGFQPDLTWIKRRSADGYHFWTDAVRGVTKTIYSNVTDAEATRANGLTAFGTDGFTVGSDADINGNGQTHVAWNWKANGAGSANTDGSISSTVSVNTTSGFSIVSYTGTGSLATVGHGLGATPKVVICKKRNANGFNWITQHASIYDSSDTIVALDSTSAAYTQGTANFNGTSAGSSVFTIGSGGNANDNGSTYIAYCFAEKAGYSKFGSYTGNGNADGPFIYTGFKPAFVMIKMTSSADNWIIQDNKRNPSNISTSERLRANSNGAEFSSSNPIDLYSNGFKAMSGSDGEFNGNGSTYIYMAFGQSLVGSNNVPCTAR